MLTEYVGNGVYTIAEAAKLTKLRPSRVREWFRGRDSRGRKSIPVFQSDYPVLDDHFAISFLDLIELFIGGKLREAGISLPKLRQNYNELKKDFGDHPFCTRQIYVGGKQIFTRGLSDKDGDNVIEAVTRQRYFDAIILPFLKQIKYDEVTERATRWDIAELVTIDPEIQFGKPVVANTGITTAILFHAYYANGEDEKLVASWFSVGPEHVKAAVNFEDSLKAAA